jgi:hypothetical protein
VQANNKMSEQETTAELSNSKSIERNLTETNDFIRFLRGQITFHDYNHLLENQRIKNELLMKKNAKEEGDIGGGNVGESASDEFIITSNTVEVQPVDLLNPLVASNSSLISSPSMTSYFTKKYLSKRIKDKLHSSSDEAASNNASEKPTPEKAFESSKNEKRQTKSELINSSSDRAARRVEFNLDNDLPEAENDEDEFEDPNNWKDFDIETLNFDRFLQDHQIKTNSTSETMETSGVLAKSTSKAADLARSSSSNQLTRGDRADQFGKRKRDEKDNGAHDISELKTKRRVSNFKGNIFN